MRFWVRSIKSVACLGSALSHGCFQAKAQALIAVIAGNRSIWGARTAPPQGWPRALRLCPAWGLHQRCSPGPVSPARGASCRGWFGCRNGGVPGFAPAVLGLPMEGTCLVHGPMGWGLPAPHGCSWKGESLPM